MTASRLDGLADLHGIGLGYFGPDGTFVEVPAETRRRLLAAAVPHAGDEAALVAALEGMPREIPPRLAYQGPPCFLPEWLEHAPAWGVTTQLYELVSKRNWGIGDFADLGRLAEIAAAAGADFVGLTPLHALFLAGPERCSPFSPSNRRFLNPLHIAVDRLPGYGAALADRDALSAVRQGPLIDYAAVGRLKRDAFSALWARWRDDPGSDASAAFDAFREEGGEALRRHALFEAISARMSEAGHGAGWTGWPEPYRDPESPAVARFAAEHADDVAFHAWLQWQADGQLREAAQRARDAGMRIGLYLDMAVGEVPDGSAVWADRDMYVAGATVGAPPDYFSTTGQEWGIAALSPPALRRGDHAYLISLIEHAARHAGALRIDHVMALWQLFLIPQDAAPADGAYVRYDIDAILTGLSALSREKGLIVIGEDLGYVPEGFRELMQAAGILSYRIVYFEREGESFRAAEHYPRHAIACLSTHDLPTLRGWWGGNDIALRLEHGLIDRDSADAQSKARSAERGQVAALSAAMLSAAPLDSGSDELPEAVALGLHAFVARTGALLAGVRLADLAGEELPTNLPGTSAAYPNWRRRLRLTLEEMGTDERFRAITEVMRAARPRR